MTQLWRRARDARPFSRHQQHIISEQILATYTAPAFYQRHRKKLLLALLAWTFLYGAAFGLTTTYFLLQLTIPLILLAAAVIWLLPESERAPVGTLSKLLFAFVAVLLVWPDYLAVALPGLPWITAVRLIGVPLAFVLFVCLSASADMREQIMETMNVAPWVWKLMAAFGVLALLAVALSTDVRISTSKLVVATMNWFLIFFVAVYVFRKPQSVLRLGYMLWIIAILVSLIGIQEWRHSAVPWAGHIPGFLAIQDDTVQRILSGTARAATGKYRVQSKFTTSLGLAEFYALVIPFIMHFAFKARLLLIRIAAIGSLPFLFWMIILTDSRLGVVGFLLSSILYVAVWALWRRRTHAEGVIGSAILALYPIFFTGFIAATFFVGRLRLIVWGSGAQQASNDSRKLQVAMGIPKILARPWGYGMGRSGDALGFANGAGVVTVDSYYLTIGLEYGILGVLVYFTIFANGIWNGVTRVSRAYSPETEMIAPVTISLVNFFVIKSIFSQQDNHALVFMVLGALVALCWKIDRKGRDLET